MLLKLDFAGDQPIYMQIRNQIVLAAARGELAQGDRLPTVRALAEECGVNMMTVSKAYQLLRQEGVIATDRRSGAVMANRTENAGPSRVTLEGLRLRLGELRLAGLDEDEAVALCRKLYKEGTK